MLLMSSARYAVRQAAFESQRAGRQHSVLTFTVHRRYASHLHPSIRDFALDLAKKQPCFAIPQNNVEILFEPEQFYTCLLDMIRRARRRIYISSLYIGSDEHDLIAALHTALDTHSSLHVYLNLDLNRSTRPGASSTALLLVPLLRQFPTRVHVSLFRSPKLRGIMARLVPPRFNEGWGTWHAKIYGIDDEVMISGANLNESYFTSRQDRYIHFAAHEHLAHYCFSFLQTVSTFSYALLPCSPTTETEDEKSSSSQYHLQWPDPGTHPHHIHRKANTALTQFQTSQHTDSLVALEKSASKDSALIYPVIQAGQFNIREEESFIELLFNHLSATSLSASPSVDRPQIDFTSGYFGLYDPYQDLILRTTSADCRVVVASPKANGFYNSKGLSGRIPEAYTLLEQRFIRAVQQSRRAWVSNSSGSHTGTGVQLREWEKDGWTYHAKGIWLSPSPDTTPILTLFGSTNLNSRSAHLDTELSFVMIPPVSSEPPQPSGAADGGEVVPDSIETATGLSQRLADEVRCIRKYARDWRGGERTVRWGTKALVAFVGGML